MTGLVDLLSALSGLAPPLVWAGFLVFLRVGAAMALLPAFGEYSVPARIRLVLTLAFTAVVAPAVLPGMPPFSGAFLGPAAAEAGCGLAIGLGLRLFVMALQIAGTIAAQSVSLAQMAGNTGPEPQPAIGQALVAGGLALAVAGGLHVRVAELLILSYDLLPAGRAPNAADLARWGLGRIAHCFALGFMLAAPFAFASVLYNIALGVMNRAMPQLMVTFIGAPALTLGGLALLAVAAPLALGLWSGALQGYLAAPFGPPP